MPFTFAHPAAVLWCARWHASVPFSAFVIGSMSPDFEYFLRLRLLSFYSHSPLGIVTFCLPIGLLVYGLYRWIIAPALIRNLPRAVRARIAVEPRVGNPVRRGLLTAIAIMFGATTHILWDGFTHGNGYFVMASDAFESRFLGLPMYKLLQHGSTFLAFGIMALWCYRQPRVRSLGTNDHDRWYWPTFAVAWSLAFASLHLIRPEFALGTVIVQGIVALFAALLAAGALFRSRASAPACATRAD